MFQGDRDQMRGAQPLAQGDVAGMRRLGRTLFRDPNVNVSFAENLKSLLPFVTNPGVVNIRDMPGGGIANLPQFGQQGLDFTREQGFRDYGATLENLAKLAVPAPLRAVLSEAGQMGDDVLLTPFKNLFNIGGEEEVVQEEPEEKKKRFFFSGKIFWFPSSQVQKIPNLTYQIYQTLQIYWVYEKYHIKYKYDRKWKTENTAKKHTFQE